MSEIFCFYRTDGAGVTSVVCNEDVPVTWFNITTLASRALAFLENDYDALSRSDKIKFLSSVIEWNKRIEDHNKGIFDSYFFHFLHLVLKIITLDRWSLIADKINVNIRAKMVEIFSISSLNDTQLLEDLPKISQYHVVMAFTQKSVVKEFSREPHFSNAISHMFRSSREQRVRFYRWLSVDKEAIAYVTVDSKFTAIVVNDLAKDPSLIPKDLAHYRFILKYLAEAAEDVAKKKIELWQSYNEQITDAIHKEILCKLLPECMKKIDSCDVLGTVMAKKSEIVSRFVDKYRKEIEGNPNPICDLLTVIEVMNIKQNRSKDSMVPIEKLFETHDASYLLKTLLTYEVDLECEHLGGYSKETLAPIFSRFTSLPLELVSVISKYSAIHSFVAFLWKRMLQNAGSFADLDNVCRDSLLQLLEPEERKALFEKLISASRSDAWVSVSTKVINSFSRTEFAQDVLYLELKQKLVPPEVSWRSSNPLDIGTESYWLFVNDYKSWV